MGFFDSFGKKPVKKTHHKKSESDRIAGIERKRKKFVSDRVLEMAKNNPEVERLLIAKDLGIDIEPNNPEAEAQRKIREHITTQALEKIKTDPELSKQFAETQIGRILGIELDDTGEPVERSPGYYGNPIEEAIDNIEALETLKERLGGKSTGGMSSWLNPDTVNQVLGLLTIMMSKGQGISSIDNNSMNKSSDPDVLVNLDGKPERIPQSQYLKLAKSGRITPIGAQITTGHDANDGISVYSGSNNTQQSKEQPQEPFDKEMLEQLKPLVIENLGAIEEIMSLSPDQCVNYIKENDLIMLDQFLSNSSYNDIMTLLDNYKDNEKLTLVYGFLDSDDGEIWLTDVINILKAGTYNNEVNKK